MGSDGFRRAAGAYLQTLNCRGGIHLKVGLKVKLKGCEARLFQGYIRFNSFPKVSLLFFFKAVLNGVISKHTIKGINNDLE